MYSTMDTYINEFADQLQTAIEIGEKAQITSSNHPIQNILLSGLGGSGIGGVLTSDLLRNELAIPMNVNNDYFLPNYVNENTLLIISSYSGNTEETLQALEQGLKRGAKIVCISANGKVQQLAAEHSLDFIQIPSGKPPRGSLNLSFTQSVFVLHHLGLISESPINQLKNTVSFLRSHDAEVKAKAKELAQQITGKIPVWYADDRMFGVTMRIKQQINENSKMLSWQHVLPEMNHNELVGWTEKHDEVVAIFLRNEDDYSRTQTRMTITADVIRKYSDVIEIWSKGDNLIEQSLYIIYLTDWVSFELAQLSGADAVEVNVIDYLKGELAKV